MHSYKHVFNLLVVMMAIAVLSWWVTPRRQPRPVVPQQMPAESLNGVTPSMTLEQTRSILGQADCEGPLAVADGKGWYAEYGSAHLTWNGHPTLTFNAHRTVLSIIGTRFEVSGKPAFALGSDQAIVRQVLGQPQRDEADQEEALKRCLTYRLTRGTMNVFIDNGRVTRMLWFLHEADNTM